MGTTFRPDQMNLMLLLPQGDRRRATGDVRRNSLYDPLMKVKEAGVTDG